MTTSGKNRTLWRTYVLFGTLVALSLLLITISGASESGVAERAEYVRPLLPGSACPAFEAVAADGSLFEFDPTALEKPVVIIFYRGGWCPYCNKYLMRLRHAESTLVEMGYEILFLSADRYQKLAGYLEEKDLNYTVLSDSKLEVARKFGIAYHVHDELFQRYMDYGHDLEDASGENHHLLPVPATFIVATDGIIHFQYANPNYKVRLDPDVLLAAARAALKEE